MFNWQEMHLKRTGDADFLDWLVPQLTGGPDFDKMALFTKEFTQVELSVLVNGIKAQDGESWLLRLYGQFERLVEDRAREMVRERFSDVMDNLEKIKESFD